MVWQAEYMHEQEVATTSTLQFSTALDNFSCVLFTQLDTQAKIINNDSRYLDRKYPIKAKGD